jgi:sugar lactone lactonase YvrE
VAAVYSGDPSHGYLGSNSFSFGTTSQITTVAGRDSATTLGDGGQAVQAAIDRPLGVAVDPSGDVFIADSGNHQVREVSNTGVISTVTDELHMPTGLAIDAYGNLFIADTGNNQVLEVYVDPATSAVSPASAINVVAGTGSAGNSGDGGAATQAMLNAPMGLAVDAQGNLFIADSGNNRIRKVQIDPVTGVISQKSVIAPVPGASITSPTGLAVDAQGNLFVSQNAGNISMVTPGGVLSIFASELFTSAAGISIDHQGNLFVADAASNQVFKVSPQGQLTPVAGDGSASFAGDGGLALSASLHGPAAVAVDDLGNLFIADAGNNRAREVKVDPATGAISPQSKITTIAGSGVANFSGDNLPAVGAELSQPVSTAVDAQGNLYIAETGEKDVIRKVDASGVITTIAGNGVEGFSGDGGPAVAAELDTPKAIALDGAGNLYIADTGNNRVREVHVDPATGAIFPQSVITTVAGNGAFGAAGDGGLATDAELAGPSGIAVDSAGNLFIIDPYNDLVREVNTSGVITTVAGARTPSKTSGNGDNGPATQATLVAPYGVTVDSAGNLYISDFGGSQVRKVNPQGIISTVAGIAGTQGYGGDGLLANDKSVQLDQPVGVAVDSAGNLFIADTFNGRIRAIGADGVINTVAGNGAPDSSSENGSAKQDAIDSPWGITTDLAGDVFIADPSSGLVHRVANGVTVKVTKTLVGGDTPNTWIITGPDSGTVNGMAFSGFDNLKGGSANDTFIFQGGSLTGWIAGGGGVNTIDWSAVAAPQSVTLSSLGTAGGFNGTATSMSDGFTDINTLIGGSSFTDSLTGLSSGGTWTLGAADTFQSGSNVLTFSSFEQLSGPGVPGGSQTVLTATLDGQYRATLTAVLAPMGGTAPQGTVTFFQGQTLLGTFALQNGQAQFQTGVLPRGQYSFTAVYSGDAMNNISVAMADVTVPPPMMGALVVNLAGSGDRVTTGRAMARSGLNFMANMSVVGANQATATAAVSPNLTMAASTPASYDRTTSTGVPTFALVRVGNPLGAMAARLSAFAGRRHFGSGRTRNGTRPVLMPRLEAPVTDQQSRPMI